MSVRPAEIDSLTAVDNVFAFTFRVGAATYEVCPLFDVSRSYKAGRVVPIKLQLCDASGTNLSRPDIV